MTKKFIHVNDSFICEVCGHENPPAPKTCRDHCRKCLYSKHVDINPGDRAESCQGILEPISIEISGAELRSIVFHCQKCGVIQKNKISTDDDREKLFEILEKT